MSQMDSVFMLFYAGDLNLTQNFAASVNFAYLLLKIQIFACSWILLFRLFRRSLSCPDNCWNWTDRIRACDSHISGRLLDELHSYGFDCVTRIFPCKQRNEILQNDRLYNFCTVVLTTSLLLTLHRECGLFMV